MEIDLGFHSPLSYKLSRKIMGSCTFRFTPNRDTPLQFTLQQNMPKPCCRGTFDVYLALNKQLLGSLHSWVRWLLDKHAHYTDAPLDCKSFCVMSLAISLKYVLASSAALAYIFIVGGSVMGFHVCGLLDAVSFVYAIRSSQSPGIFTLQDDRSLSKR